MTKTTPLGLMSYSLPYLMDGRQRKLVQRKYNEQSKSSFSLLVFDLTIVVPISQLQSLDAAKTAFFSNASHELRTPLTLIYSPLEDCISRTTDTTVKNLLKLAFRNASRLSRLVDSLMDFSRLEAGRLRGSFKPVHLSSFTHDLANMFRPTMEKHNLEVSSESSFNEEVTYHLTV